MSSAIADPDDQFLTLSQQAITASGAAEALESLGWWHLLEHLDDYEMRSAVLAFFRAQGGALASSVALGGLIAQPFLEHTGLGAGQAIAAIGRQTVDGPVHVIVGHVTGGVVLIDRPGHGTDVVELADAELRPIAIPGRLTLHAVQADSTAPRVTIPEDLAAPARQRSIFLGRLAISAEILGAAERAVELATEYATDRQQFGKPIGTFQAIRHLLAWAHTECVAVDAALMSAIRLDDAAPPMYGEVVKALAGRNGRRVCERTLQVLGGIGFTAEHDHHHLHSRVLALDGLLGTSAELTHQLGRWLRTSGAHPGFTGAERHSTP